MKTMSSWYLEAARDKRCKCMEANVRRPLNRVWHLLLMQERYCGHETSLHRGRPATSSRSRFPAQLTRDLPQNAARSQSDLEVPWSHTVTSLGGSNPTKAKNILGGNYKKHDSVGLKTKVKVDKPMFKPAAHQVAGHQAQIGKIGPVVDGVGKFYKPLQDEERGEKEKAFYEYFWADKDVPSNIQGFFPRFYGTSELEGSDGFGVIGSIVLEDLTHQFRQPCVIDLKMGVHTWYPGASEQYIEKCKRNDANSSSATLGFRVSGMQVFETASGKIWKPGRLWCKMLDANTSIDVLKRFVSSNPMEDDAIPDRAYASAVYGGEGIITQLCELRSWFATQTRYQFYSSSILLIYEGGAPGHGSEATMCGTVKLVDFAHVLTDQGVVDENFLQGLDSLIRILREIVGQM